ncbi:MAG TPA: HAD-IA family hydrolase [Burkholderiales bacterium]
MKNYDLIVFDWDGTIMDSTGAIVAAIQASAVDLGLKKPEAEMAAHVIGLGLQDALLKALPELDPKDYPKLAERYRFHYLARDGDLLLFDGMAELLADLKAQHYWLAVATGKSRAGLDRALKGTELVKVFDGSRCADETHSKPHPQMLIDLMDRFGAEPARTLMIGDTTHDSQMAKNAGTHALSVTYGAHPHADLLAIEPHGIVHSVPELSAWLKARG